MEGDQMELSVHVLLYKHVEHLWNKIRNHLPWFKGSVGQFHKPQTIIFSLWELSLILQKSPCIQLVLYKEKHTKLPFLLAPLFCPQKNILPFSVSSPFQPHQWVLFLTCCNLLPPSPCLSQGSQRLVMIKQAIKWRVFLPLGLDRLLSNFSISILENVNQD